MHELIESQLTDGFNTLRSTALSIEQDGCADCGDVDANIYLTKDQIGRPRLEMWCDDCYEKREAGDRACMAA